jgi:hypothetical protein
MSALVKTENKSLKDLAKIANDAKFWHKVGGESELLSIMETAKEIGLPPMMAINGGIHNIEGKIEISARAMQILIRRHGHQMKIKYLDNTLCKIWGKRKDTGEEFETTFSIEDAKTAGIMRPNGPWYKYPRNMLHSRAISDLGKWLFADCIGMCYVENEISETKGKETIEMIEAPFVEHFEEPVIVLPIPEGVDAKEVEQYIEEISKTCKQSVDYIKSRVLENPTGFWEKFNTWLQEKK